MTTTEELTKLLGMKDIELDQNIEIIIDYDLKFERLYYKMKRNEELLIELRDTINFFSEELPATIEHRSFFESLAEHYKKLRSNKNEIYHLLEDSETEEMRRII